MLRRQPTTITLTTDDLALFERSYAQGQIYPSHAQAQQQDQQRTNENEAQKMAAGAGEDGKGKNQAGAGSGAGAEADEWVRSREERIRGNG